MYRQTDTFEIEAEDGTRFRVYEFVEILNPSVTGDLESTVDGLKRLLTSEGHHVTRFSETDFEIVGLGIKATRA